MVTALSFDADQTLWDFHEVHQRALESTAAEMIAKGYVSAGGVDAGRLQAVRNEVVVEFRGRRHNLEAVRERSFEVFLERAGCEDAGIAAASLAEHFLDIRFNQIRLYPEVRPSLERLKRRYRIGLLSNGNSYPERCGLPDVFDAVVLGPSSGIDKPDVRAFESMAQMLGVEVRSMIHIGDAADDVDGANRSGAVSVLIVRNGRVPDTETAPDYTIRDLDELETLLDDGQNTGAEKQ